MPKSKNCLAIASAFACLAVSGAALAQTALVGPRIYDSDGRLVGTALPAAHYSGTSRVLLTIGAEQVVLGIRPSALGSVPSEDREPETKNFLDGITRTVLSDSAGPFYTELVYYEDLSCQGAAYMLVTGFPSNGIVQGNTVFYPARPFTTKRLNSWNYPASDRGSCTTLQEDYPRHTIRALVGVAASAPLPIGKPPFVTK